MSVSEARAVRTVGADQGLARGATLVGIASACHSGSTLLDMLLGNHSRIVGTGEMNRLTLYAEDRICTCGETVVACPFWSSVRVAVSQRQKRPGLIRWDECHTDVPPQKPLTRLTGSWGGQLVEGPVPADLLARLRESGLELPQHPTLERRGVRDLKWQLMDGRRIAYILRHGAESLDVYAQVVGVWKSPLRLVPEPLEVALALGTRTALNVVRSLSPRAAEHAAIAENTWTIADAITEVTGVSHVVDSSKSAVRLKLLYLTRPENIRIVHLIRDGRAVSASAIRRIGSSAATAARVWKRENQNLAIMLRSIPARVKLSVRYEEISKDTPGELRRICDFLGLEYEDQLPELWAREVHNIPGNPMLFNNRGRRTISTDDRWRTDLRTEDLQAFERAAGRLNRSLGYV
jgi:hypothetical protein